MKQYIKNYFILPILLFVVSCWYNSPLLYAEFDMGGLSEDDVMAMQQALQDEINRMSPAEKENFYQIMENVERMSQEDPEMLERFITGQMSKEEESQFVNTMVPESMAQTVTPNEIEEPTGITPGKEQPKTIEVKELNKEQLSIQEMITSIIAKTESFLVKMQSYPEINSKIKSWSKNNNVMFWPANKQWKDVEFDINLFIQKLFVIEHEKNSDKKKAFIDAVLEKDNLFSSLKSINNILINYEKTVDIAPFGITKIKKETKDAMQKIINSFTDEIYSNQINNIFDDVLKIYEAEDKKLKDEEAERVKKAQQESGKTRSKEYMKSAGQEKSSSSSRGSGYSSKYDDYDYGSYGDYGDYGSYGDYSSYNSYPSSSYRSPSSSSYSSSSSYPSAAASYPSAKRGGSERYSEADDYKQTGRKSTGLETKTEQPTKKIQTQREDSSAKKNNSNDRYVYAIENYLEKVVKLIAKKDKLKELDELFGNLATVLKKEFTNEEIAQLNEKLSHAVRYLTGPSKSALQSLKALAIKLKNEPQTVKDDYKKQVEERYNEYKDVLTKFLEQMLIIEKNLNDLKITNRNTHYLWDSSVEFAENVDKSGKELSGSITESKEKLSEEKSLPVSEEKPKPTTFNDLKNAVNEFKNQIEKFIK